MEIKCKTVWENTKQPNFIKSLDSIHPSNILSYYGQETINAQTKMEELIGHRGRSIQLFINNGICCKLFLSSNKLLDSQYNHKDIISMKKDVIEKSTTSNDVQFILSTYDRQQLLRRCFVGTIFGITFVLFGIISIILYVIHFSNAVQYCNTQRNHDYLELYTWDYCTYKVYPFIGLDKYNHIPCQCRSLDIDSNTTINLQRMLSNVVCYFKGHIFCRSINRNNYGHKKY